MLVRHDIWFWRFGLLSAASSLYANGVIARGVIRGGVCRSHERMRLQCSHGTLELLLGMRAARGAEHYKKRRHYAHFVREDEPNLGARRGSGTTVLLRNVGKGAVCYRILTCCYH